MDRRMYRGNVGYGPSKGVSPYRPCDPVCGDVVGGYDPDDYCDKGKADYGEDFDRFPLGMCYVPWQKFVNIYDNEFVALDRGTIFKDLDLEFYGRSCK